jgi:hypothetical protein
MPQSVLFQDATEITSNAFLRQNEIDEKFNYLRACNQSKRSLFHWLTERVQNKCQISENCCINCLTKLFT